MRFLAFAACAIVAAWVGCAIYDASLLLPRPGVDGAPPSEDGGDDASRDASADSPASDGCSHLEPPPPPTTEDGTDNIEFVAALRTLDFGASADAAAPIPRGFDLDDACACPGPGACKAPQPISYCDDVTGADNSGGALIHKFAAVSGGLFDQSGLNQSIAAGAYGFLVRVRGYNGGMNDKQVEVDAFPSNGTPPAGDGGMPAPPRWDGNDAWTLDSTSVFGGGSDAGFIIPNYVDLKAYVSGGILVSHPQDFPLQLGGGSSDGNITMRLTGMIIAAAIVRDGASYRLDQGHLAGRWPTKAILSDVRELMDPTAPGRFICPGTPTYEDVRMLMCGAVDMTSDPAAPSTARCDAVSMAVDFTTGAAKLGPVTSSDHTLPCADAGPPEDCP